MIEFRQPLLPSKIGEQNNLLNYFTVGFIVTTVVIMVVIGLTRNLWAKDNDENNYYKTCARRIVGYYYFDDRRQITTEQLSKLTHIVFQTLQYYPVGRVGLIDFAHPFFETKFRTIMDQAKIFKVKKMYTQEIGEYKSKDIPGLMNDSARRTILVNAMITFIRNSSLDGVNLHWEPPTRKVVGVFVTKLCRELREGLEKLAQEIKREDPYIISMVCQRDKLFIDFDEILKYVDFLNIETSTYYAHWYKGNYVTGPPSPLYLGHDKTTKETVSGTLSDYSCLTKQPNRLNMMISFTGHYWKNVIPPKDSNDTLWLRAKLINGKADGGWEKWREFEEKGWNISNALWNNDSQTPYIYDKDHNSYMAFENKESLEKKMEFEFAKNIGGITVGNIGIDDDQGTLLNAIASSPSFCSKDDFEEFNFQCDGN